MINYTRGFSNSPKQWMNFQALLGFSCHKLNWYVDTNLKPVKLIILQFLTTQLFPVTCHSLQLFLLLILAKKLQIFSHTNIYRHCANGAPGPRSQQQQTQLGSPAWLLSLRVSQHPDNKHQWSVHIGSLWPVRPRAARYNIGRQTFSHHRHIVKLYNF